MNHPATHDLLAIDVGNSRIKFGLFERSALQIDSRQLPSCRKTRAVLLDDHLPWQELQNWLAEIGSPQFNTVIAGANPAGIDRVLQSWPSDFDSEPVVATDVSRFPLHVHVDEPHKVGIDRLLTAVAANLIRPQNTPVVVVDTGTATTVNYLSPQGAFEGGAILPGFRLSARSLHHYTALLPLIETGELHNDNVPPPLGRNTRDALKSGIFWGQLGAVKELIAQLTASNNSAPRDHFILLTGGGASLLAPHLPQARWEPHLALQGLALVAQKTLDSQTQ